LSVWTCGLAITAIIVVTGEVAAPGLVFAIFKSVTNPTLWTTIFIRAVWNKAHVTLLSSRLYAILWTSHIILIRIRIAFTIPTEWVGTITTIVVIAGQVAAPSLVFAIFKSVTNPTLWTTIIICAVIDQAIVTDSITVLTSRWIHTSAGLAIVARFEVITAVFVTQPTLC